MPCSYGIFSPYRPKHHSLMTCEILKPISLGTRIAKPGEKIDLPKRVAESWIRKGVAKEAEADAPEPEEDTEADAEDASSTPESNEQPEEDATPTSTEEPEADRAQEAEHTPVLAHKGAGWYDIVAEEDESVVFESDIRGKANAQEKLDSLQSN